MIQKKDIVRYLVQLPLLVLPWGWRRPLLARFLGYRIDPTARVRCALISADEVFIGPYALVDHLTIVKGLAALRLEAYAQIGRGNRITGFPLSGKRYFHEFPDRAPRLTLGEHAHVLHQNIVDCTDSVTIGAFSLVAGWKQQIITHGISLRTANQSCAPVVIGRYCLVGTGCILLKGARLPDYSVLGAGSVLRGHYEETYKLYSGVPAVPVSDLDPGLGFFHRLHGESDVDERDTDIPAAGP